MYVAQEIHAHVRWIRRAWCRTHRRVPGQRLRPPRKATKTGCLITTIPAWRARWTKLQGAGASVLPKTGC